MEKINANLKSKYVVVYWDHQNISRKKKNTTSFAEDIVAYAREEGTINRLEVYADWTITSKRMRNRLRLAGFHLIQVDNTRQKVLDFEITSELGAITKDMMLDTIILVTSDGDYLPAINLLKRSSKEVIVIGNPAIICEDLMKSVSKFVPVTKFTSWGKIQNFEAPFTSPAPIEEGI